MGIYRTRSGNWGYSLQRNGKRIRITVGTRAEAESAFAAAYSLYEEGTVTLYPWMGEVIKRSAGTRTRNTILSYANSFAILKRELPDLPLDMISPDLVRQCIKKRLGKVSPATVNRELNFLSRCYTLAQADGITRHNPTKGLKLLEDGHRIRYLSVQEIRQLLDACTDPMKGIIEVALYTGMRKNEVLSLCWRDLDGSVAHVHRKWGKGKTQAIRLPIQAIDAARRQPQVAERIFPYTNIRKPFQKAVTAAGLLDVDFHTLRHTFASQAVMSGMPLRVLQELLGHRRLDMVLRYAHLGESHVADVLERVANDLAKSVSASRNVPTRETAN